MTDSRPEDDPLAGLRVLEFDSPLTAHAGRLLWEMGADVVLVEPPGGSPSRSLAGGAVFAHHHAGKQCIQLDGSDRLTGLLAAADVVIEATTPHSTRPDPSSLEGRGDLIHLVCSPFGPTGPRAHWRASDLVVSALGGVMAQIGWPDGPPQAPPADQAWHLTGLNGVIGVLLALAARRRTGAGQRIDVSALECVAATLETGALLYIHTDGAATRTGTTHPIAPHRLFRAADGWLAGGLGGNPRMGEGLLQWMDASGEAGDLRGESFRDPEQLQHQRTHVFDVIEAFTRSRPRETVFHEAQARRLPWASVLTLDEVATSPQLLARGALVPVSFDGHEGVDVAPPLHRRAGRRVVTPIGGPGPEWSPPARSPADGPGVTRGVLEDVTVLDLTWVLAGPYATRILADNGARVVKVESRHRPDPTRFSRFSHLSRGAFDPDTSGYFNNVNRNKRSITLNLRLPEGIETFRRLAAQADVVIENFSAGALDRLGIGASDLRAANPGLIAVSMSGLGATGPWKDYVSYADVMAALAGFTGLATDGERPTPVVHGLADIVAGHHAALATLAALEIRRRSGEGATIDLSQSEAIASQIGHSLLARTALGAPPERRGTAAALAVPNGVYRCLGPDRWVAITVDDEPSWRALCAAIERNDLAADHRLASVGGRAMHAAAIDAAISAWTAPRPAPAVAERLQGAGIAAGAVQDGRDLVEHDPQLRALGFYQVLDHPAAGPFIHEGDPIHLSTTPGGLWDPAPLLGADTDDVLSELDGFSDDELARLRAAGALE
ncbi:MAG: CoA transferase [Ilumatobacteraceae bacterium]